MEKYGETLFALDQDEETRLRLLAEVFDPLCTRTLAALGVARDARCLEVGAGSGSVARWLCGRAPQGDVVATDLDTTLLERIPEPRLRRLVHDVTRDPFPDDSFDVVHARLVLSHLPQRDDVMRRMLRWLRPGGFVLIESFCWFPVESSPNATYRKVMQRWSSLICGTLGTDSWWSRGQPGSFLGYGYRDVGANTVTQNLQGGTRLADFWRRTVDMSREPLLSGGYVTPHELEEFHALLGDGDFWDLAPALVQSWGRK
ncbi:class I SAM-dependent methyltransferase [Streptomyces sp. NRRL S-340]|uniref:class I SAM-dependent methyltransferase n=1 Tax=Streptomyces sp. NRRL S-340 TaxID=1463901 RepID=UPI00068E0281|nr:class I SAM-dependent methyltransferase [Streptomyces sp. NRRL S-340]